MTANIYALGYLYSIETLVYSLLAFLLYSFYQGYGRRYVKYWTLSLVCLSGQYLSLAAQQFLPQFSETSLVQISLVSFSQVAQYLFIWLFCLGCYFTSEKNQLSARLIRFSLSVVVVFGLLWPLP